MGRSYYPRLIIRWKRSRIASCLLLPVGNGRLGTMVFGKTDEERIHLKDTGEVSGYRRWLNLSSGITGVEYEKDRVIFRREVCFDLYDFCK